MPFVTEVWQIYVLIFVLQSASAAFTPTFQATIPDYCRMKTTTPVLVAIASGLRFESVASPMLAAAC